MTNSLKRFDNLIKKLRDIHTADDILEVYNKGFNDAVEECKKVAETKIMVFKGSWITNDVREFREQIAEQIGRLSK